MSSGPFNYGRQITHTLGLLKQNVAVPKAAQAIRPICRPRRYARQFVRTESGNSGAARICPPHGTTIYP